MDQTIASTLNDPSTKRLGKLSGLFKRPERNTRSAPLNTGEESRRGFFRGRNQSQAIAVTTEELSEDDVIIAVMGPTGAGKSSFINMATGNDNGVGHDLESCTTEITIVKFHAPERSDLDVLFVDTPGFDDTNKSDVEILNMLANWLKTTYSRNIKLAGIIYFHRISDNRMAGSPLKNLRMFKELCGKNALQNIILTTTMWDEVDESTGVLREKELKAKYWKAMIDQGSRTIRYFNTPESAWNIIDQFVETANDRYAILLQQEMVDMEMELRETRAGQVLFSTLDVLVKKQQEMLLKIRVETKYHADESVLAALKEEFEDLRKQIEVTVREMETLKISLGKRFLRMMRLRFKGKVPRR